MNPFEAIQYVGTPIALVAFAIAIAAWVYRGRLAERRQLIESAPKAERARLLEATIRDFTTIPTDTLTQEQRYDLAVRSINERAARFRLMTIVAVIVAVLFTAVVVLFTLIPGDATSALVVRVHGPAGSADFVTNGAVTLDAGQGRETRALGADGQVRFDNVPRSAWKHGVKVIARVPGYRAATDSVLTAAPANGVLELALTPIPTRVYGTVMDASKQPLRDVVVIFQGGVAADTTDQMGNFSVVLPYPVGSRVLLRALKNGRIGFSDMITIPEDASLTIFFAPQS